MAHYANNGSHNITVVDGTQITGLYAPDGSWNVVVSDGVGPCGVYHPCGAFWVTVQTDGPKGLHAPDGSYYVQETPYTYSGGFRATVVSGSLDSIAAPVATWISDAATTQAVFEIIVDDDVVSGDKIWGESSTDNFATVLETVSAAISAGDLIDLQIDSFAFSPFTPDGTYYARFWISNSADVQISAKSNVISQTILTYPGTYYYLGF